MLPTIWWATTYLGVPEEVEEEAETDEEGMEDADVEDADANVESVDVDVVVDGEGVNVALLALESCRRRMGRD